MLCFIGNNRLFRLIHYPLFFTGCNNNFVPGLQDSKKMTPPAQFPKSHQPVEITQPRAPAA